MRTGRLALTAFVSCLALAACQKADNAAVTAKSAAQAQVNPTLSTTDTTFLNMAARAGSEEVIFGQLAGKKASSRAVRDFAAQMVADHTPANAKLMALAQSKQLNPPTTMDGAHQATYDTLEKTRGRAFDKMYMDGQVEDHQMVVDTFRTEATNGTGSGSARVRAAEPANDGAASGNGTPARPGALSLHTDSQDRGHTSFLDCLLRRRLAHTNEPSGV